MITIPVILVSSALAILSALLAWFGSTVIEVDRTQESVLATLMAQQLRCNETQRELQKFADRQETIWHELLELSKEHQQPVPKWRREKADGR